MLSWWFKLCIFCVHWKMLLQCVLLFVLLEIKFTTTTTTTGNNPIVFINAQGVVLNATLPSLAALYAVAIKKWKRRIIIIPTFSSIYIDVILSTMATQITSVTVVCSTVYSGADQRNHQSASLAFWGEFTGVYGQKIVKSVWTFLISGYSYNAQQSKTW